MLCWVVGPVLDAFGYERIIFGTSPASSSPSSSDAGNWYEIARESFAELALEQAAIDSIFSGNAKAVYGQ
jgi:predicted TIM-barrel fold metal-dependent hydrolase